MVSSQPQDIRRYRANGWVQGRTQLPEHRYHILSPQYSSRNSAQWHSRKGSFQTTSDESRRHERQESTESQELEFNPNFDPTRASMVDGMLQSLNEIPHASGPLPDTETLRSDFSNGEFRPSTDPRDWQRARTRSSRATSLSSSTQTGQAPLDEPDTSDRGPTRSGRPFFHRRRHTAGESHDKNIPTTKQFSDADRRELAKATRRGEKLSQVPSHEAGIPRSRMKRHDASSNMDVTRPNRPRDESPSNDFDLNPQDHYSRRRSRSYNEFSVLNRSRPVPVEYHTFDDDAVRRLEAQRHALRKSTSYTNTPERQDRPSSRLAQPAMPASRQASSRGSVGGGADSPLTKPSDVGTSNVNAGSAPTARVPHSQSFTSGSLRGANDAAGKEKGKGGFLKRMFGSSGKGSSSSLDLRQQVPQLPPLQTKDDRRTLAMREHQGSKSAGAGPQASGIPSTEAEKQPPPRPQQLRSKRSFFQRRRKTLTEQDMPEMPSDPAPPHSGVANHQSNRPSTSSLRQVMNPYISEGSAPRKPDPYDVDVDSVDDRPPRRKPEPQSAYEFLRSSSPGSAGLPKPGTQLPPRGDQERRTSTTPRQRPATSARDSKKLNDSDMQQPVPARAALDASAAAKASRRRSATSPSAPPNDEPSQANSRSPTGTQAIPRIETASTSGAQSTDPHTAPAQSNDKTREKAPLLLSDRPFERDSVSRGSSSRTWIQADDSSEENIPAPEKASKAYVDATRSPQNKDVGSDASPAQDDFSSARSVPTVQLEDHDDDLVSPLPRLEDLQSPSSPLPKALPSMTSNEERARQIFEAQSDPQTRAEGAVELGEPGAEADKLRAAFMSYFDFTGLNILLALRDLCARMTLKGETQQMDRIMSAFSRRWCECNPSNGFKSEDVVHTICYSLLLLNTDLHVADLTDKMTRNQFVKNTIPTLRRIAEADSTFADTTLKAKGESQRGAIPFQSERPMSPSEASARMSGDDRNTASRMSNKRSLRPTSEIPSVISPSPYDTHPMDASSMLVDSPYEGSMKGWESTLETVLKEYYLSIRQLKLPLHGAEDAQIHEQPSTNSLSVMTNLMRRTGSVISKTPSDDFRGRANTFRHAASRFASKNRSRPRLYPTSTLGSSRTASHTSFEDNNFWSPSASSITTQSKSLTTMSTDSLHSKFAASDFGYQQSIGFANALSHVIVREEGSAGPDFDGEDDAPLLDDESLALAGAPWAKEGNLQHKHHLESEGKKAKDRNWSECFAVIQRGTMRLFSFTGKGSTRSAKKAPAKTGGVVGGGNWLESAEKLASFTLRHTIANALPPPGYSKQRPHVFALSLPTGAVHLFHVGTAEIAQEFVQTANYWSARLSKEPLVGGVSSIEYGWGESVINNALTGSSTLADADKTLAAKSNASQPPSSFHLPRTDSSLSTTPVPTGRTSSSGGRSLHSPTHSASFSLQGTTTNTGDRSNSSHRPSISGSLRSSFDAPRPAAFRNRLPADRLVLGTWQPPQQSLMPSRLHEPEQLAALKAYVASIEHELAQHNELRAGLVLAFTPRSVNAGRAAGNWERKSHYLLREIVKFRTYVDVLEAAQAKRGEVGKVEEEVVEKKRGNVRQVKQEESKEDMELSEETLEALRGARAKAGSVGVDNEGGE